MTEPTVTFTSLLSRSGMRVVDFGYGPARPRKTGRLPRGLLWSLTACGEKPAHSPHILRRKSYSDGAAATGGAEQAELARATTGFATDPGRGTPPSHRLDTGLCNDGAPFRHLVVDALAHPL